MKFMNLRISNFFKKIKISQSRFLEATDLVPGLEAADMISF